MRFDHIETMMKYCILHRLFPTTWFDWEDISIIKSHQDFSRNKTQGIVKWMHHTKKNNIGKVYNWIDLWVSPLFLFGAAWKEVWCIVKIVGWNGTVSAHAHVATNSSSSTFPCGDGTAIAALWSKKDLDICTWQLLDRRWRRSFCFTKTLGNIRMFLIPVASLTHHHASWTTHK